MPIRVKCSGCQTTIRASSKYAGKVAKCPNCRQAIRLPERPLQSTPQAGGFDKTAKDDGPSDGDPFDFLEQLPSPAAIPRRSGGLRRTRKRSRKPSKRDSQSQQTVILWSALAGGGLVGLLVVVFSLAGGTGRDSQSKPDNRSQTVARSDPAPAESKKTRPQTQQANKIPAQPAESSTAQTAAARTEEEKSTISTATRISARTSPNDRRSSVSSNTSNPAGREPEGTQAAAGSAAESAGEGTSGGQPSLADMIEQVDDGIVLLTMISESGRTLGLGSGFLIDASGLVATNFHVLSSGGQARAQFRDGTEVDVVGVRGYEKDRDLAIVQLAEVPPHVEVLSLAKRDAVRQGTDVIAIGHPRGLKFTTTTGIVSAIHLTEDLPADIQEFVKAPKDQVWIQTNATMYGGSSGGPLLNPQGEVVGVNTWITSDVDFGFALDVRHLVNLIGALNEEATPLAELQESENQLSRFAALGEIDEKVQDVIAEFRLKYEEFRVMMSTASTVAERQKLMKTRNPSRRFAARLIDLAKANRQSKAAYQALIYSLMILHASLDDRTTNRQIEEATSRLIADHLQEEALGLAAVVAADFQSAAAREFLRELAEKSPLRDVQGVALFSLAKSLSNLERSSSRREEEIAGLLERVIDEFGDVALEEMTLAEAAEPMLFALQHLSVGKTPPDIVGTDIDGNQLKLSDYRGKVVMLDFFVDWCPYCTEMYPLERVMVERSAGAPFALLGINCDDEATLREVIDSRQVTWPCFADGQNGPIAQQWQISSYPMIYLLDHRGVIRYRFEGKPDSQELMQAIRKLVDQAEAAQGKGRRRPTLRSRRRGR